MTRPKISVVVPVYNMAESLPRCLAALLGQDYPNERYEVIVVDNGSTDRTPQVVGQFPVIRLTEQKRGAPAARNRGILAAAGEIIAFTDADCVPARGWLRNIEAGFSRDDVQVVAGMLIPRDPLSSPISRYSAFAGQYDSNVSLRHPRFPYAATANVAVRRSVFSAVGIFDETFLTFDSADLFFRIKQAGLLKFAIEPRAAVFYETRKDIRGFAVQNFRYGRGYARFCYRHADKTTASRLRFPRAIFTAVGRLGIGWRSILKNSRREDRARHVLLHAIREVAYLAGALVERQPAQEAGAGRLP